MFDTVKLAILLMLSESELENIDWTQINTTQTSGSRTVFLTLHDADYKGCPRIRYTFKEDDPSKCWLKVEVSVPTFLNGSNVYELDEGDIDIFFRVLRKYLANKLKISVSRVPPLNQSVVEKVHVCKNFNVGHMKQHYLKALSKCTIPRYQTHNYFSVGSDKVESVEWKASKKKEKVYDKEAEIRQQRKYPGKSRHENKAKGLLRYEIELSDFDIRQINHDRKAEDVLDIKVAAQILQRGIERNGLGSGIKYSSLHQVIDAINNDPLPMRTKSALIAFITELQVNGEEECRKKYAPSTFRKRKKQLREILGVKKLLFCDTFLPPLKVIDKQKRTASV